MRPSHAPLDQRSIEGLSWAKMRGLLPATVQDRISGRVLMTGYMNTAALERTIMTRNVTFWSRSKERLWKKGETSGNFLADAEAYADCDGDALLVLASPAGPACHQGTISCFATAPLPGPGWLADLSSVISRRRRTADEESYTSRLFTAGTKRISQKVGEEGVELALAGASGAKAECVREAADLLYHIAVLLEARGVDWAEVIAELQYRQVKTGEKR